MGTQLNPKDPQDLRLANSTQKFLGFDHVDLDDASAILLGYPDDEGIRVNQGRGGAAQAPDLIRSILMRMTPPKSKRLSLWDAGNLSLEGSLWDRHARAIKFLQMAYQKNLFPITLGGGHDYGYPDSFAFAEHPWTDTPVVLNFDAHLDVRSPGFGLGSGTPFYRLLDGRTTPLHFLEVGLQEQCNGAHHIEWAQSRNAKLIWLDEIRKSGVSGLTASLQKRMVNFSKTTPVFLSVDMDVFSAAFAPGCSQVWPTGLGPDEFFSCLEFLGQEFDLRGLGIYETSPPLDSSEKTVRFASLIVYKTLHAKFWQR